MNYYLRMGLVASFVAVLGGIAAGLLIPEQVITAKHVRVAWGEGELAPDGAVCVTVEGITTSEARAALGLDVSSESPDGRRHTRFRLNGVYVDENDWMPIYLPEDSGISLLFDYERITPGQCAHKLEAWLYNQSIDSACGCAPAASDGTLTPSTCEMMNWDGTWHPAIARVNFHEGMWRGDCIRKPCAHWEDLTPWPNACGPESL